MKHSQLAAPLSTVRDDLLNASAFADTIKRDMLGVLQQLGAVPRT
jgi:hypothetical protein